MNAAQIHLAMNHIPLIVSLSALVILAIAALRHDSTVARVALGMLVVAALAAIPTFRSGEPAEELIEHMAGVHEDDIERHEDSGKIALALVLVSGALAGFGLFRYRGRAIPRGFSMAVALVALVLVAQLAWTSHLGGLIRHPELKGETAAAPGAESEHD